MSTSSVVQTDFEILSDVINPEDGNYEPDVARAILRMNFSDAQNQRMRELANRNNRGELTEDEQHAMESFRRIGNLLAIWQAKARLSLKQAGPSDN